MNRQSNRHQLRISLCVALLCLNYTSHASDHVGSYSPEVGRHYPDQVFWGDTHVHTSFSTGDANLNGGNTVSPAMAYRFARGETVTAVNGERVRLRRPLDFLVIADHAENLAIAWDLQTRHQAILAAPGGKALLNAFIAHINDGAPRPRLNTQALGEDYERSVWSRIVARADAYNDPGRFTTFSGYEWSSLGTIPRVFGNLHRVVIFKDSANTTRQIVPFGADDSPLPRDLWKFLQQYEDDTGGEVIAIPHNPNLSNGQMFDLTNASGEPIDTAYASLRQRFEPLMEVTQIKGDSEAHPLLSPDDPFADFETWHSWGAQTLAPDQHPCCINLPARDERERKQGDYARGALKRGLALEQSLGVNPYKVGLIGSTDTHASLSTADSDNYWGKYSSDYPKPSRMTDSRSDGWPTQFWNMSPAGYAAVWAKDNTRPEIFAAMKRREVYASTGPRITLRLFAGWDFEPRDQYSPNLAATGYATGIPMGGDLSTAPEGRAPRLLMQAARDPDGANLDRIQVIKGWIDSDGNTYEQVYNVAASDNRRIRNNRVKAVGNSVDLATATYINNIGDPELSAYWEDPDFDPAQAAFYYVRALEIPTPRWTAYDVVRFGMENVPDEIPMVSQERAYSSPIWYHPAVAVVGWGCRGGG
ncbi:MAG: DUF3604 domain-containing protein, partial [Pseudomonadota bacterium]